MCSFLHTQLFETWFGSVALTCDGLKSSVESWSVKEVGRALESGVCVLQPWPSRASSLWWLDSTLKSQPPRRGHRSLGGAHSSISPVSPQSPQLC